MRPPASVACGNVRRGWGVNQDQTIIALADALGRERALTLCESRMLEQALRREQVQNRTRRAWTATEDAILADAACSPITSVVAAGLAERLERTTWAVNTRVRDLRKASRVGPLLRKRARQREAG